MTDRTEDVFDAVRAWLARGERVALATVVQRFKWSTVATKDPGFEIPFLYDTTITFPKGVHVTATPRAVPLGAERGSESQAGVGEESMAPAR